MLSELQQNKKTLTRPAGERRMPSPGTNDFKT